LTDVTNITPPRVPFLDERTGFISREWYRFFLSLFNLTGGGTNVISIPDVAQSPDVQADMSQQVYQQSQIASIAARYDDLMSAIQGAYLAPRDELGTVAPKNHTFRLWTPAISFATPGDLSVTYTQQVGTVLMIGSLVVASFNIVTSAFTHTTASGNLLITGLSVPAMTLTNADWHGSVAFTGLTMANYTNFVTRITSGATDFNVAASGSAQTLTNTTVTQWPSAGTPTIRGTICYFI
jgi:hypothetical protein